MRWTGHPISWQVLPHWLTHETGTKCKQYKRIYSKKWIHHLTLWPLVYSIGSCCYWWLDYPSSSYYTPPFLNHTGSPQYACCPGLGFFSLSNCPRQFSMTHVLVQKAMFSPGDSTQMTFMLTLCGLAQGKGHYSLDSRSWHTSKGLGNLQNNQLTWLTTHHYQQPQSLLEWPETCWRK